MVYHDFDYVGYEVDNTLNNNFDKIMKSVEKKIAVRSPRNKSIALSGLTTKSFRPPSKSVEKKVSLPDVHLWPGKSMQKSVQSKAIRSHRPSQNLPPISNRKSPTLGRRSPDLSVDSDYERVKQSITKSVGLGHARIQKSPENPDVGKKYKMYLNVNIKSPLSPR